MRTIRGFKFVKQHGMMTNTFQDRINLYGKRKTFCKMFSIAAFICAIGLLTVVNDPLWAMGIMFFLAYVSSVSYDQNATNQEVWRAAYEVKQWVGKK